ncbi:hypothetical protein [Calidifontibacillus erzurumensis]|uniref:hypothetical protein n=1 Tax=Calidifontibacillus erzurumensis TaxID=2741433 RepID=UPI0035B532F8
MVDLKERLLKESAWERPFLFYMKNGKLLKCRGIDKRKPFVTIFFVLNKKETEQSGCITLEPLVPVKYCKHTILKTTDCKVTVRKDSILGIQCLPDPKIADVVIEHHQYKEKLVGKFAIPKGFSETIVWKSNDDHMIYNLLELVYDEGDKEYLEANVQLKNGVTKTYKLLKQVPTGINITDGKSVSIIKRGASKKASGRFTVEYTSEAITMVQL